MSQTVAQAIEKKSTALVNKLATNLALSNLLLGFLGKMSADAITRGKPIEGIEFGTINGSMGNFSFRVFYRPITLSTSMTLVLPDSDLHRYFAGRAAKMAVVLEKNPGVRKGFEALIEAIDRYCEHKGKPFKHYEIDKAFVTPADVFHIRQKKEGGRWAL